MTPFSVNDDPEKSLSAPLPNTKAPPWIHTITGRFAPFFALDGAHTFRNRQSSEEVLEIESAPRGKPICAHSAPNFVASRTPFHAGKGCGGRQRYSPTGGAAKGMPLKKETSSSVIPRNMPEV